MMATSRKKSAKRKANFAEKQKEMCRLFNDHDACLIDDLRREFDALLMVPLTPRDIKLTFEKAVVKVAATRSLPIRSGFGADAKLVCPGCNHDPHKSNCVAPVIDAAGNVDWCQCGTHFVRLVSAAEKALTEARAKLNLAIVYMTQEAAFGLYITFPPEVQHLADKRIGDLTAAECNRLAKAGMKAHHKALGL